MKLPQIIGLCGYPGAGKTEVQKILAKFDSIAVDDGRPMRKFAVDFLGLSWDDVLTQEGKKGFKMVAGVMWQNRDILGQLGNKFEELFGVDAIPFMSTRNLKDDISYTFGSVRRAQGRFYQKMGGVILGVRRPGVERSIFEFDRFDEQAVDLWIDNDGTLEDLEVDVVCAISVLRNLSREVRWVS